jgi:hypothetical protein
MSFYDLLAISELWNCVNSLERNMWLGTVFYAYNPSTREAEVGG